MSYSLTLTITGLNNPTGVAVDSVGNIYVANYLANQVLKYNSSGGSPILTITSGLNLPQGVALDSLGNIYVANVGDNNVIKYNTLGGLIGIIISGLRAPRGIALDSVGNIYVANYDANQVLKYNSSGGSPILTIAAGGPQGVALDSLGNIYVANSFTNTVTKHNSSGGSPVLTIPQVDNTTGVAVDSLGYIYVANYGATFVAKYNSTGQAMTSITILNTAYGIGLDYTNNVYVATYEGQTVLRYSLPFICFKEGTKILTNNGYKPIEELKKGDLVKTLSSGYKKLDMIGYKKIWNPASDERIKDQLYVYKKNKMEEVFEDLVLTGCHSVLIDRFETSEKREKVRSLLGGIFITEKKARLPACLDERAEIYKSEGFHTIYHVALENEDYYNNYGIYANGLLAESCSQRYLKELSGMILIE